MKFANFFPGVIPSDAQQLGATPPDTQRKGRGGKGEEGGKGGGKGKGEVEEVRGRGRGGGRDARVPPLARNPGYATGK
jgi:hypothetical protein